jgi:hypothetical protein
LKILWDFQYVESIGKEIIISKTEHNITKSQDSGCYGGAKTPI